MIVVAKGKEDRNRLQGKGWEDAYRGDILHHDSSFENDHQLLHAKQRVQARLRDRDLTLRLSMASRLLDQNRHKYILEYIAA
jgi:hypothetical protein